MPPDPLLDDEDYASEEDSDFAPDAVPANGASDASESESEDEDSNDVKPSATTKRKRPAGEGIAAAGTADNDDDGFENSGDEAIIQKGKKRRKKAKRKDGVARGDDDDDGGGDGGLIKTRSMRATEKTERKSHAITGPVTINVDDLWAKMTAAPIVPPKTDPQQEKEDQQQPPSSGDDSGSQDKGKKGGETVEKEKSVASEPPPMIKIKRTYNFAGKVHTEEKLVLRDSAEAKLYLASLDPNSAEAAAALAAAESGDAENDEAQLRRRRPRKAFRSAFEPVVEGATAAGRRSDLDLGMAVRLRLREQRAAEAKAKKLNVVEKSRMDWAGFVDKEGLKDELELAGRAKDSYAGRQDFLARVDANREEEARRARIAGRAV